MLIPNKRHIVTGLCLGMAIAMPLAGCTGQLPNSAEQLNNEVVDRPPLSPQQLTEQINAYKIPSDIHIDTYIYAPLDGTKDTFDINQSADISGITTHRMVNDRFPTEETVSEYYTEAQKEGTRTWKRSVTNHIDADGNITEDDTEWHTTDKSDAAETWCEILQTIQNMTIDNNARIENDLDGSAITFSNDDAKKILDIIKPVITTNDHVTKALDAEYDTLTAVLLVTSEGNVQAINITLVPTNSELPQTIVNIVTSKIPEDVLELIHTPDSVKADTITDETPESPQEEPTEEPTETTNETID